MRNTLRSILWNDTKEKIRKCHLSLLGKKLPVSEWNDAFDSLIRAIQDERKSNPTFATELYYLTIDTGFVYDIKDILEEYFDYLEENKCWDNVIKSSETVLNNFAWNNFKPSEYKYRIGNALLKQKKLEEAKAFGEKWLKEDPNDLFCAAANSFLLVAMGKTKEAADLCKNFLDPSIKCDKDTETVFMAAMALYDKTDDKYAKRRVEEKIAEYNNLIKE